MLPCVWRTKHIHFNLKITPIGLFTIQIEAGCVNRRLRLKMDCKNSSFSAAHARTCTHNHTFSSFARQLLCSIRLNSHNSSASAQAFLIKSQQLMTSFTPQLPVPRFVPHICIPTFPQFFRRCGSCDRLRLLVCRLREPIGCFLLQRIDKQMACHISPCKVQVLQSAASCRTCFTADWKHRYFAPMCIYTHRHTCTHQVLCISFVYFWQIFRWNTHTRPEDEWASAEWNSREGLLAKILAMWIHFTPRT